MAKTFKFDGGQKLKDRLSAILSNVNDGDLVKVGFLEGSTENKGGVPTAYVALVNEFGGTIPERTVPEHTVTIYRKLGKNGDLLRNGKFVKRGESNFETDHVVPEHTIPEHEVPARPFFRSMIKQGKKHWGHDLGLQIKHYGYSSGKALAAMGLQMGGELQKSILAPDYVPLADSTIAKKDHSQTLVDSGDMINAVDFEVD